MGNFVNKNNQMYDTQNDFILNVSSKDKLKIKNKSCPKYDYMGFKSKEMFIMFIGTCGT